MDVWTDQLKKELWQSYLSLEHPNKENDVYFRNILSHFSIPVGSTWDSHTEDHFTSNS